jgi:hypothetical protein
LPNTGGIGATSGTSFFDWNEAAATAGGTPRETPLAQAGGVAIVDISTSLRIGRRDVEWALPESLEFEATRYQQLPGFAMYA